MTVTPSVEAFFSILWFCSLRQVGARMSSMSNQAAELMMTHGGCRGSMQELGMVLNCVGDAGMGFDLIFGIHPNPV